MCSRNIKETESSIHLVGHKQYRREQGKPQNRPTNSYVENTPLHMLRRYQVRQQPLIGERCVMYADVFVNSSAGSGLG